jgi:hypothetical protein
MADAPDTQWLTRIEGALDAHFVQPGGGSRPGTDWAVGLKRGEETHRVMVRTYFDAAMSRRARADREYQGQTVLGYVGDLLGQGWTPDKGAPAAIVIRNPPEEPPDPPATKSRPWWRFWS